MSTQGAILFYKAVNGLTTEVSSPYKPDNGKSFAVSHFRANGYDTTGTVYLVWDRNGAAEKYIAATSRDVDLVFDTNSPLFQFVGDGVKKLEIVLINSNVSKSPVIGGYVEVVSLG